VQVGSTEGEDPAFATPANLSELAGAGGFAGIVSDTPFDRLTFSSASPTPEVFNAFSLDDAVFVLAPAVPPLPPGPRAGDLPAGVPLPARAALLLAGLSAFAGLYRPGRR